MSLVSTASELFLNRYAVQNNCTLDTCPIELAEVLYDPSLGGNTLYLTIFAILVPIQAYFGIRHCTWSFLGVMTAGLILEIIGYAARVQLHFNPFHSAPFVMYLICLTIGPIFFAAGIYLCFSRLIVAYGANLSYFRPRTYVVVFIVSDIFSLILQAAGGGIAAPSGAPHSQVQNGIHIMVAGLALQVASLACFGGCCVDFYLRVRTHRGELNPSYVSLRASRKFCAFLCSLSFATICIFVRSVFRVAELSEGFGGKLANQEVTFMILEGAMIVVACISLTALNPGVVFEKCWGKMRLSPRTAVTLTKAVVIIAWVVLCGVLTTLVTRSACIEKGERRLVLAVTVSVPFILVHLFYSIILSHNPRFNLISGSVTINLVTTVLEELVVIIVCLGIGLTLRVQKRDLSVRGVDVVHNSDKMARATNEGREESEVRSSERTWRGGPITWLVQRVLERHRA